MQDQQDQTAQQEPLQEDTLQEDALQDDEQAAAVSAGEDDADEDALAPEAAVAVGDDEEDDVTTSAEHLLDDDDDEAEDAADVEAVLADAPEKRTLRDEAAELPSDESVVKVKHRVDADGQVVEADAEGDDGASVKTKRAPRKRWYIVHTYSGHENKVKINLERRIESMNMADKIFRVEVPQKSVTKIKDGRRSEREERIFPGYVLVEMIMDDDSWYVVRHTPGVTKFVGSQKRPIPAKDTEIRRILMRNQPTVASVHKVEIDLKTGEVVKIISGPFADFEGTVTEISPEKERLKASVIIFGRETPVELAFNQVQKMN